MSDRVALMKDGRTAQLDTPEVLYAEPKNSFAADFVGMNNMLPAIVRRIENGTTVVELYDREVTVPRVSEGLGPSAKVWLCARPEAMEVVSEGSRELSAGEQALGGELTQVSFQGSSSLLQLQVGEQLITAEVPRLALGKVREGDRVRVILREVALISREDRDV